MKSNKDLRGAVGNRNPDDLRKGTKLPPMKKSGKERHALYSELEEDEQEDYIHSKKESVLDYFEDGGDDDL